MGNNIFYLLHYTTFCNLNQTLNGSHTHNYCQILKSKKYYCMIKIEVQPIIIKVHSLLLLILFWQKLIINIRLYFDLLEHLMLEICRCGHVNGCHLFNKVTRFNLLIDVPLFPNITLAGMDCYFSTQYVDLIHYFSLFWK